MGLHQYKLEIVPKRYVEDLKSPLPKKYLRDGLYPWLNEEPDNYMLNQLRDLLPNDNSWPGGDVEEYITDNMWGSDCRIYKESGKVENIIFRYSPGVDKWDLIISFIRIVDKYGYVLVNLRSGQVLNPDENEIKSDLLNSVVFQFIQDPEGTIIKAAEEIKNNKKPYNGNK